MKLYGSLTSPFVRKVRVLALEAGLEAQLELVTSAPTPIKYDDWLIEKNPLGKIPVLELEDGTQLFDSRVICEYLDSLHVGRPLLPAGPTRWQVLRNQALADGILDAGILMRYETLIRPAELQWPQWLEAQANKVTTGLNLLDQQAPGFSSEPEISQIATACTLGWLLFRKSLDVLPAGPVDFAQHWPHLHNWYTGFAKRPSMTDTEPVG